MDADYPAAHSMDTTSFAPADEPMKVNQRVRGKVSCIVGDEVWIDVNYTNEGAVSLAEWYDEGLDRIVPPLPGEVVPVLIEAMDAVSGRPVLSYRKARGCLVASEALSWQRINEGHLREGYVVTGFVARRLEGGLLVCIAFRVGPSEHSMNAFLPMSEVALRLPAGVDGSIGETIACEVLQIDPLFHEIVVGRPKFIERQPEKKP